MLVAEFLTAVLFAFLFVAIFGVAFGRTGPWPGFFWFFLIVLLGAWAVGTWAEPVGPVLYGVSWVPFLLGALIIALLVAAMAEPRPREPLAEPAAPAEAVAVGLFFWIAVLMLIGVIFASVFIVV
ncbi:MAG: hypothetical protein R3304_08920 [Longimicrobiales bacterium]|nr:hypothetical protein [Longimicrobiales bacterium]